MQSFDTNYDLIVCRNVMIYFTEEARVKLYESLAVLYEKAVCYLSVAQNKF